MIVHPLRRERRRAARAAGAPFVPLEQKPSFREWTNPLTGQVRIVQANAHLSEVAAQVEKLRARLPLRSRTKG